MCVLVTIVLDLDFLIWCLALPCLWVGVCAYYNVSCAAAIHVFDA